MVDNKCLISQKALQECPYIGWIKVNGNCRVADENCIFFHSSGFCQFCAKGYRGRAGKCEWLECEPRQYNGNGTCLDVDQSCDTFDKINGNCLTCIDPEINSLQTDGKCRQMVLVFGAEAKKNEITCNPGYWFRGGTCVEVHEQCKHDFDPSNGRCRSCKDPNIYYLTNGQCLSTLQACVSQPRTYFKDGACVKVMETCDMFNQSTGWCIGCLDNTVY